MTAGVVQRHAFASPRCAVSFQRGETIMVEVGVQF